MSRLFCFLTLFFASIQGLAAQPNEICRLQALRLLGVIEKYHVNPPTIDTAFSAIVFDAFISKIDPKKIYFSKEDYVELNSNKYKVLTGLQEKTWNFYGFVRDLYFHRILRYDSLINNIFNKPVLLTGNEVYHLYNNYCSTQNGEFTERVKKWLTYRVLNQMMVNYDSDTLTKSNSGLEEASRKKVLKLESDKISKKLKQPGLIDDYLSGAFLNAISSSVDPHCEYMSNYDKKIFESNLESEKLSFGFQLDVDENEDLVISGIVPGGSAWKSNAFHKGDVLVGIKIDGKPKIAIDSIDLEELTNLLTSVENQSVLFFLHKSGGIVKPVELKKTLLEQEENKVRSCILKGKVNVGYISLPEFYTEFENHSTPGCASDVAKECIKMQKENISGLILDLRDNGGGSVKEAIDLAGLFINYGPICITKEKGHKPSVIKDFNRGTAYDGPLLVLVNKQSASATEIFASAMQDYKRGIIVGDHTYGKATAQVILPCDTNSSMEKTNHGFVKLTIEKVYRITGKSNQKKGLVPDIKLPDIISEISESELDEKRALAADSVDKAFFTPLSNLSVNELRIKSRSRLSKNESFLMIQNKCDSMKMFIESNTELPLNIIGFSEYYAKKSKFINILDQISEKEATTYKVDALSFNNSLRAIQSEEDVSFLNMAQKDIYVEEAYNIISDMIELKAKF